MLISYSGFAQFPAPYCGPMTFTSTSGVEPITLVNFAGINNSSSAIVGPNDGTTIIAHEDYTTITGNVAAGSAYPIILKGNTAGLYTTYLRVYIDWNQNNDFTDAGESYDVGTIYNSTGEDAVQLTGSIQVPPTAKTGNTRMRIIKRFNGYGTSCQTGAGYGQTEDYNLTVAPLPTDLPDNANIQTPFTATINQGQSVTVYGQVYEGGLTDVDPNITGQAPGINAWVGYSTTDTNPDTWTNWVSATWNSASIGNNDEYQAIIGSNLTPNTYYFATRFQLNGGAYVYGGTNNGFWDGTNKLNGVLTVNPPIPPVNDECFGAISVPVNSTTSCTSVISGTLLAATASSVDAAACGGTEDDDVWFSFVATSTIHTINLNNVAGSTTDLYHSLWTGDCNSLTLVPGTCSDLNSSTPSGLTIGQTYYLRVYSWTATTGQTSTFDVCIGTPPPPPANDDCINAILLTCGSTSSSQTTESASGGTSTSCVGTIGNDIWYKFIGDGDTITVAANATVQEPQVEVYESSDGTCSGFTAGSCFASAGTGSSNVSVNFTSALGKVYYIHIGNWINGDPGVVFDLTLTCALSNTSIDESKFEYYPNPVKNTLNLSYNQEISNVDIFNLMGQKVSSQTINANQGQVDMTNLSNGVYLVKVTSYNQVKTLRVIKE